jgi:flagellar motility protein MotE (MotC chaperone)
VIERPRLIPAVILGAMALLALKLLAWTSEPYPGRIPVSGPVLATRADRPAEPQGAGLAKVIATANAPSPLLDPETTGAIDPPTPKADPAQKANADAASAANPNNKADVMNGAKAPTSPAERAILERLGERREEIDARMRELEMRERLLDTAEKKLDSRVGDLKAMEEKADGPGGKVREEEAKAVKNLVIMYEAMKPKEAARVFDRLGLDVLVPVVQQMNPRKMSEVLAAMSPERAEKLTVALATTARSPGIERAAADLAPLGGNELPAITPAPRR